MDKTPKNARPWKVIDLTEPVEGLDDLYDHDRARYADATAEEILGVAGRMIAGSKSGYSRERPENVPVFNANVCTTSRGKVWFGDLDLTVDESLLCRLAAEIGETIYVLFERDARFGNEDAPEFGDYVLRVEPSGDASFPGWIVRGGDSRLYRRDTRKCG